VTVFVSFKVSVLAEVDLESGAVVGVRVDDEAVGAPTEVFSVEGAVTAADRARAQVTAESEVWPAWEFGP